MVTAAISLAEAGNADAQNLLGVALEALPEEQAKAIDALGWYQKSAAQSFPKAWYNMALLYAAGANGIPKNAVKAKVAYDEAIELGYSLAYANRGVHEEEASPPDYKSAMAFYEKSHQSGDPAGIANLATLYARGLGVEIDYPKAKKLFDEAAAAGSVRALDSLGYICMKMAWASKRILRWPD